MDLTSDFYQDPKTGQPIRFIIGVGEGYAFPEYGIKIYANMEIWNTTKDKLITTQKADYIDNLERRKAWFDTPLSLMVEAGLTTFGQVFTAQVLDTLLKRRNIDPITDKL